MWASTTTSSESTATATAGVSGNGMRRTQQSSGVWTYDGSAFDSTGASSSGSTHKHPPDLKQQSSSLWTASGSTSTASSGAIGSGYVPKSRLLWNRTAPEEEEREEEALPSYLTYLQPSFRSSSSAGGLHERIPGTGGLGLGAGSTTGSAWSDADSLTRQASTSSLSATSSHFIPSSATFGALSPTAGPFVSATATTSTTVTYGANGSGAVAVETKTKELALALQEFVRQQVEAQQQQQQHRLPTPSRHAASTPPPHSNCQCEPLKLRVSELEQKLMVLSQQVSGLMANQSGGASALNPVPPPPPGVAPLMQPPLPPTPPQSNGAANVPPPAIGSPSSAAAAASGINDRVSTLEGRQSAFQSQLAQISKVLGVPIGKHGKNSQIKNLVQTLRDEIDAKIVTSSKDVEAKCVATVAQDVERMVARAVDERLQDVPSGNASSSQSQLSYDAVFGALAEEHEASLGKLSAYFEERLAQESKQRVGLESRIQSRFGEHEEWLQQLEGEFGSWHDRSSSVATQLRVLHNKIVEMDEKWKAEQLKWSKLASDIQLGIVSSNQTTATSSQTTTTTTTTHTSVETLTRTVHQLQTQYKQFHSEYKTETSELRENLVLMDTWVKTSRQETRDLGKSVKGMKQLVEKLVRDTGSAEELLQQYVSTITHQVASVTRQYVSVRIRDNNRLIDATLRARVPAYVENESESFMLVRPEKKAGQDGEHPASAIASFVLKDDDEEGIRSMLKHQQTEDTLLHVASVATSSESSGSSSPAKN